MSRLTSLIAVLTLSACGTALAKPRVVVRWSQTGGAHGMTELLKIRSDNVALAGYVGVNPLPAQLGADQVAALRKTLDAANLQGSKRHYGADGSRVYSVTYRGRTVDGSRSALPKRIWRAVHALERLYDDIFASSE